ncbi:DNA-binding response regulator [Xylanimonas oleitrophica]|uniref:DNA-binding response regulator n=1 Tax=Xylanimonas oleitrophica TaxID=2607479 RepID=A0A2W5YCJ5_9MICO|nr:response regulator transcription factor [Xylanimonas oleitrophica]PZR51861.1 DNA-binding response regulator [Xylanimonas oleitrophica]
MPEPSGPRADAPAAGAGDAAAPPERLEAAAPRQVSVAVVDDNPVIRMGLRALVDASDRLRFAGEAGDGEAAVAMIRATVPDVTLLDVRMPRRDGVQVLSEVHRWTRVIMLTYTDAPEVVRAAVEAGAAGYLVHGHFATHELERAVLSVAEGTFLLSGPAMAALRPVWTATSEPARPARPDAGLSDREVEVMELVAQGLTNGDVAARLFLAEKTVKNHVNHIFAKLGVRTRAEAVAVWLGGGPA